MKYDERGLEEINKDIQLLKQKDEIDRKLEFYKETLYGLEAMYNFIDERIERGYITSKSKLFGFIPILTRNVLDSYDLGKLKVEKHQLKAEVASKQNFYTQWLSRKHEYEKRIEEITKECEENFDELMKKAEEVAIKNLRLAQTMERYWKEEEEKPHDQITKNEFYMFVRREVSNRKQYGGKNKNRSSKLSVSK